jgi:hypothetical protein
VTASVNATQETLRAIATTLKMAAILDDRAPHADKARIAAWSERAEWHRLTETDLLDGLQTFYDQPQDRSIAIGDLIHHARYAKRTRLDHEADAEREQRRQDLDTKVADDETHTIAAGIITGPTLVKTPRLLAAETALQCAVDKRTAIEAIREYHAAKIEARKEATV